MTEPSQSWPPQVEQPAAVAGGRGSLPGSLMAAAIILFVFAVLSGLLSLLLLLSSALYDQIPNSGTGLSEDQFRAALAMGRTFVLFFGVAGLLVAGAHVLSGIGIIRRAGWARILGIVIASLGVLLSGFVLLSVLLAMGQPIPASSVGASGMTEEQYRAALAMGFAVGAAIFGGAVVCYLFVLVALIRGGAAFR
jgi:hypothetical protein